MTKDDSRGCEIVSSDLLFQFLREDAMCLIQFFRSIIIVINYIYSFNINLGVNLMVSWKLSCCLRIRSRCISTYKCTAKRSLSVRRQRLEAFVLFTPDLHLSQEWCGTREARYVMSPIISGKIVKPVSSQHLQGLGTETRVYYYFLPAAFISMSNVYLYLVLWAWLIGHFVEPSRNLKARPGNLKRSSDPWVFLSFSLAGDWAWKKVLSW